MRGLVIKVDKDRVGEKSRIIGRRFGRYVSREGSCRFVFVRGRFRKEMTFGLSFEC